jgi:hypothetical protein
MDVMVEFAGGGPLDGQTLASGENPEFDANKAKWILWAVASSLDIAQRKENPSGTLLVWRVPSPEIVERAKTEQWPEAKRNYLMQYHVYHITGFQETEGLVLLKAYYQGIKRDGE